MTKGYMCMLVIQRVRFDYCFLRLRFDWHAVLSGILSRVKVEAPTY